MKKVSRFTLATPILAMFSLIALLLMSTAASAYLTEGDGGTSGCTLTSTQAPSTTKEVCGADICTTTTIQVPQTSSQQVLISAGYSYDCPQSYDVPGYYDYEYPSCYDVPGTQSCQDNWQCDYYYWWECWNSPICTTSPSTTVCPAPYSVWVPGYTYTYTGSCWAPPVYDTQQVTTWVSQEQKSCQPNCQKVTVPGDITYSLVCPTPAPITATPPPPTTCYRDCVCAANNDCCSDYSPSNDPACQPKICSADQEVSRSCSGCKTATITKCNSYGTATTDLTGQLDNSCTSGCASATPTPTPTPSPAPAPTPSPTQCTPNQQVSKSCSGTCNQATTQTCNSLGTSTYSSTVTDTSCTGGCATPTPIPSSCLLPMDQCNSKPKGCAGNSVTSWSYDCSSGKCNQVSTPCPSGQTCSGGVCQATTTMTCKISCSGDTAISWHLSSNACIIDAQTNCAAQGKLCKEDIGCVAPTVKQDCTSQGCPSGYYCSTYGVDIISGGNTAFT